MSKTEGRGDAPAGFYMQDVSAKASEQFSEALPRLLSLVNDKFAIDTRILGKHSLEDLNLFRNTHRHFGDMLRSVYEFGLQEQMLDEFAWYVSTLSSRGFGEEYFRKLIETWMIAIHSAIKPPESGELTRPLAYICRRIHGIYSASDVEPEPLSPEAQHFLSLLLDKKRRDAVEYALDVAARSDLAGQAYSNLVLPALSRVGLLWQKNRISVADEHAATEIGRYVLFRLLDNLPKEEALGVRVLVACVPGEEHDIGIQIASGYLGAKGWDIVHIGRSAPANEIIKIMYSQRPRVAVFSMSMIARLPAALDLFETIRDKFRQTRIIAGGRAAIVAREVLKRHVDGIVDDLDQLHDTVVAMVGEDA